MSSIYDNGLYNELRAAAHELEPWFDIDKVKSYSVYVWTKGETLDDEEYPFGENVFDIYADYIQFYRCNHSWQLPNETIPIIKKIQEKLKAIENHQPNQKHGHPIRKFGADGNDQGVMFL